MEKIRPFVKWAGGKTAVINQLRKYYPMQLVNGTIDTYIEPFVGGGAVLIDILQKYNVKKAYALDINKDLINCFNIIKNNPNELIKILSEKGKEFLKLSYEDRKLYYYDVRHEYNSENKAEQIIRASQFIFLNKTCFNGLYRVNSQDKFNVPFGKYKNPTICDIQNILNISKLITNVEFICDDYSQIESFITSNTFIYFDPPYRPIKKTSGFTSYTKDQFDDDSQIKLAKFYRDISDKAYLMLSNSNPKNVDPNDCFFDDLYSGFNINIIDAKRMINSNGKGRGTVSELIITNYKNEVNNET